MKQNEKNRQSRDKILCAAINMFGEKGYDGTSLNTLLLENGLSKGLLYHYFDTKDQLYLNCVKLCFEKLVILLSEVKPTESAQSILRSYFEVRNQFFTEYPMMERIFFNVLLQPPTHLCKELTEIKSSFEQLNHTLFYAVLSDIKLRDGITNEDALYYFNLMQSSLHLQFRLISNQKLQLPTSICYEEQLRKTMDILLYGLAGRDEK